MTEKQIPQIKLLDESIQEKLNAMFAIAGIPKESQLNINSINKNIRDLHDAATFYQSHAASIAKNFTIPSFDVPKNVLEMSWYSRLSQEISCGRTVAVRGPAGNGKSTGARAVLESLGYNVYHLDCTDSTTSDMLVGGLVPEPDGKGGLKMAFRDGIVNKAFKDSKGAILLDEFDALDSRIALTLQSALHRSTRNDKKRYVSSPDHESGGMLSEGDCPIVVTMNTWGSGATREYVGRNALDSASMDRFDTIIDTNYESEEKLLLACGVTANDSKEIMNLVNSAREKIKKSGVRVVLSTRRVLNMAESVSVLFYTPKEAFAKDFLTRLNDTELAAVDGQTILNEYMQAEKKRLDAIQKMKEEKKKLIRDEKPKADVHPTPEQLMKEINPSELF